jgi:hypothetical protein
MLYENETEEQALARYNALLAFRAEDPAIIREVLANIRMIILNGFEETSSRRFLARVKGEVEYFIVDGNEIRCYRGEESPKLLWSHMFVEPIKTVCVDRDGRVGVDQSSAGCIISAGGRLRIVPSWVIVQTESFYLDMDARLYAGSNTFTTSGCSAVGRAICNAELERVIEHDPLSAKYRMAIQYLKLRIKFRSLCQTLWEDYPRDTRPIAKGTPSERTQVEEPIPGHVVTWVGRLLLLSTVSGSEKPMAVIVHVDANPEDTCWTVNDKVISFKLGRCWVAYDVETYSPAEPICYQLTARYELVPELGRVRYANGTVYFRSLDSRYLTY